MKRLLWLIKAWRRRVSIRRLRDAQNIGHHQRCQNYLAVSALNGLVWGD